MQPEPATPLPAGPFSSWREGMRAAIRGAGESDVPCDGCTACCRASQFVHIAPEETDTLAHIPPELLFPAPGRPTGHRLMGYDEQGRCPMLGEDGCRIYEHRPRTCRTYDCRVFAAADVLPDEAAAAPIAARAARWRFEHPTAADRAEHDATRRAAAALAAGTAPATLVPVAPVTTTELAVMAVELSDRFAQL